MEESKHPRNQASKCYTRGTKQRPSMTKANQIKESERKYWCLDNDCITHLYKDKTKFVQLK